MKRERIDHIRSPEPCSREYFTHVPFHSAAIIKKEWLMGSVAGVGWLLLLTLSAVGGEVYTSTAQLEQVLRAEKAVVAILDEYSRHQEQKLLKIKNYVSDYHRLVSIGEENGRAEEGERTSHDNPLKVFQLMKRLAIDWVTLENEMSEYDWNTALGVIKDLRSEAIMPQEADLQGAALALIRLKHTYHLNVSELTRGVLQGIPTMTQLSARDCLYLGRNTLHLQLNSEFDGLGQAIEWLEAAMMVANREGNQTAGQEEIRPFLQEAIHMYDRKYSSSSTFSGSDYMNINTAKRETNRPPMNDEERFNALCRGERLRPSSYESKLTCYFKSGPHPYLLLNRLKVEVNNLNPDLYTFHDAIYDKEIEAIQSLSKPLLRRSTVVGKNGAERQISDIRTSQNAWLYVDDVLAHPILERLHRRINIITGLRTQTEEEAEALQVANYGIGGHYVPHFDYLLQTKTPAELQATNPSELAMGDRIATLMFYLSDVSRGGATAFPKLGTAIWPRKGSAAFWYNLKRNGKGDEMTLHGACPVLHGSKWVGNKWIRERSQMTSRQCSLNSYE